MTGRPPSPTNRTELLAAIEQSWHALMDLAQALSPEQWSGPTDAAGWSAKDHLAHLAAWERSLLFLLEGKPAWDGVGISQEDYFSRDIDGVNEIIRQHTIATPPDAVLRQFREQHAALVARIGETTEDRLALTYSVFVTGHPGQPGKQEPTMIEALGEDTWQAYDEHRGYIERILAG